MLRSCRNTQLRACGNEYWIRVLSPTPRVTSNADLNTSDQVRQYSNGNWEADRLHVQVVSPWVSSPFAVPSAHMLYLPLQIACESLLACWYRATVCFGTRAPQVILQVLHVTLTSYPLLEPQAAAKALFAKPLFTPFEALISGHGRADKSPLPPMLYNTCVASRSDRTIPLSILEAPYDSRRTKQRSQCGHVSRLVSISSHVCHCQAH